MASRCPTVQKLVGVIAKTPNAKGVLITTSYFSRKARTEAASHANIELIDLDELIELIAHIHPSLLSHAYRLKAFDGNSCANAICPGNWIPESSPTTGKYYRCSACESTKDFSEQ